MNKKIISASLAAFVALGCTLGCKGKSNNDGSAAVKGDVKLYTDGMAYSQSAAREEKEVYSLYYEYLGGAGVMPIGGLRSARFGRQYRRQREARFAYRLLFRRA